MIIFGTRGKVLSNKNATKKLNCKNCSSQNTVTAFTSFRYFHIFWIPFFPISKKITTQCSHCKQVQYQNELNEFELQTFKGITNTKIPWRFYFGLILIGLFFALITFTIVSSSIATGKNAKNPEVNDIYEIENYNNGKRTYTVYKIVDVTKDSVTFEMNDYEVESVTKVDDLMREHPNDYSEKLTVSKEELVKMYKTDVIHSIHKAKE